MAPLQKSQKCPIFCTFCLQILVRWLVRYGMLWVYGILPNFWANAVGREDIQFSIFGWGGGQEVISLGPRRELVVVKILLIPLPHTINQ